MKLFTTLYLCILLSFISATAQTFEGNYDALITTQKKGKEAEKVEMKMAFKGKKMRMEMNNLSQKNAQPMLMFVDFEDSTMVMVMNQNGSQSGMKMKIPSGKMAEKAISKNDSENAKFTKTSETKTIDGRTATKLLIETDKTTEEFWVVQNMGVTKKDFTNLFSDPTAGMKKYKELYAELEKSGSMPMEVKMTDKKSGDVTVVEVKNFKKTAVADSVFDLSTYSIMDLTTK